MTKVTYRWNFWWATPSKGRWRMPHSGKGWIVRDRKEDENRAAYCEARAIRNKGWALL